MFYLYPEPYSAREARIHLRRLRDLLNTSFENNAQNANDNLSFSFYVAVSGMELEGFYSILKIVQIKWSFGLTNFNYINHIVIFIFRGSSSFKTKTGQC